MKALILAAGEGRRLLPLSARVPKPLLEINQQSLIERHVHRLVEAGYVDLVVNLFHLGEQIVAHLGDGSRFGAEITYIRETTLLETGGSVLNAMRLLKVDTLLIVNGDIYTDYDFAGLTLDKVKGASAFLVMVENPPHHPEGDFAVEESGTLVTGPITCTYSGMSILTRDLFAGTDGGSFPLRRPFDQAVAERRIRGEIYRGFWSDVGTLERYQQLQESIVCSVDTNPLSDKL